MNKLKQAQILQGGMGFLVSGWQLALGVAMCGQVGIVSGTGLPIGLAARLQFGDPGGHLGQVFKGFPIPEMARRIWDRYFVEGGQEPPFKLTPAIDHRPNQLARELLILSSYAEVALAKLGHSEPIGFNVLEKIQPPHLWAFFGAILAGVDFIIAGAGLPIQFPEVLARLTAFEPASYSLNVVNGPNETVVADPSLVMSKTDFLSLGREQPLCIGIVSTSAAARILDSKTSRGFAGFVVEGPRAGGHNAPPRKSNLLNELGEPIYDMEGKDNPRIEEIQALDLPFWLAGEQCSPMALKQALALGACGVQIGTAFSLCRESGMRTDLKLRIIADILAGTYSVLTDPRASPSGYPLKIGQLSGTLSTPAIAAIRDKRRICTRCYLRHAYRRSDGSLGWRCPAEPVKDYLRKGGMLEDTVGVLCVCHGLAATVGYGQKYSDGYVEPPLITSGNDISFLIHLLLGEDGQYGAKDVINYMLGTNY